jgi:hypothetical protein
MPISLLSVVGNHAHNTALRELPPKDLMVAMSCLLSTSPTAVM